MPRNLSSPQAATFWTIANGHKEAGEILQEKLGSTKGIIWHPIVFCFLRSIELALKSYLLNEGICTIEMLRKKKLGHQIAVLLKTAEANGFSPGLNPKEHTELEKAFGAYADKYFEYPGHTFPNPKPKLKMLHEACRKVLASAEDSFA